MYDIKKSKYFQVSLGVANTMPDSKSDYRVINESDKFQYFYNTKFHTNLFKQGKVGDITFYVDHYILDDSLVFYLNQAAL